MTQHFRDRLRAGKASGGVFILPQQQAAIGEIIESLLLVWAASQAEEWRDGRERVGAWLVGNPAYFVRGSVWRRGQTAKLSTDPQQLE